MSTAQPPTPVPGLEVTESDVTYATHEGGPLLARVYRPAETQPEPLPVVVAVHGGAWNANDRVRNELANRTFAASGIVVVSLDFRQGPDFQHPCATSDIVAGVRWTRLNAAEFGGDPDNIGLVGNSSGGHLAILAAIRPDTDEHQQTALADGESAEGIDAHVRYVIAQWPVSDPLYRFRYATRMGREALVANHLAYFGDEATMRAASVTRILDDGEAQHIPSVLVIQPGEDANVPLEMTQSLVRAFQKRGAHLEYAFFPGEPHAFTYEPSDATERCLALIVDFVHRQIR